MRSNSIIVTGLNIAEAYLGEFTATQVVTKVISLKHNGINKQIAIKNKRGESESEMEIAVAEATIRPSKKNVNKGEEGWKPDFSLLHVALAVSFRLAYANPRVEMASIIPKPKPPSSKLFLPSSH